ncbi:MAG: SDR family NAD(P)-dependent oxidoreductase [Candidatus Hodarchaeales archaeon]|jgi:NAD(P)-dependent dehydrogenase (short-subunit alcohol dehydrogenase family)
MKSFKDKVTVITGAASGIGFGLAEKTAREGMKIVLADIEMENLKIAKENLSNYGVEIHTVQTDVSSYKSIQNLANEAIKNFDEVHLLFNNAGVGIAPAMSWEYTLKDWEWILGVNLWGVIYCLNEFVPRMLQQNNECQIVNTASASGLLSHSLMVPYSVTKHSVVALSETLYNELQLLHSKINVSVLCPGLVNTNIISSERNRNELLKNPIEFEEKRAKKYSQAVTRIETGIKNKGMPVEEVVKKIFSAISEKEFYILTHPWIKDKVQVRMENIISNKNPVEP